MFANYPAAGHTSNPKAKFEFVEEQQHPDLALLGEVLEDIKKRTSGLVAERNRLAAENTRLEERVQALELQLAACEEEKNRAASTIPLTPSPSPSTNPAVGERIRALVDEIDACIALMPRPRELAQAEIMTA